MGRFPTIGFLLLVIGIVWLLSELKVFIIDIPWLPILVITIAIGWIINSFLKYNAFE